MTRTLFTECYLLMLAPGTVRVSDHGLRGTERRGTVVGVTEGDPSTRTTGNVTVQWDTTHHVSTISAVRFTAPRYSVRHYPPRTVPIPEVEQ